MDVRMPLLENDQPEDPFEDLALLVDGRPQSLSLTPDTLVICSSGPSTESLLCCTTRRQPHARLFDKARILNAEIEPGSSHLSIAVLDERDLHVIEGSVTQNDLPRAHQFVQHLMQAAYASTSPGRRLKVLWNPTSISASGQGKAGNVWRKADKILRAAKCAIDAQPTQHANYAFEIGASINPDDYDAVVLVSGDGLPYEFINGVKSRGKDAQKVLEALPVAQIGAGTSNALACNVLGPSNASNTAEACLAIVKGQPTPIPLCKIQQESRTFYSFLSQAFGLLADADVGSDAFRWAGRNRVYVAYAACVIAGRAYPCKVDLKIVEDKKEAIKRSFAHSDPEAAYKKLKETSTGDAYSSTDWTELPLTKATCFYAGTLPWTDPGLLAFPTARGDGLIDVIISESRNRIDLLTLMDGTEVGKFMDHHTVSYYRVSAYRLTPMKDERSKDTDLLVVDGERIEYAPMEVSVDGHALALALHPTADFLPAPWSAK